MSKKLTAVIAARKGSKRIKNKNIRDFCGSSLLEIKIRQALRCNIIDRVYVSTDCESMISIARNLGAVAVKRPASYCTDSVPMNNVYEYLANSISADHIVYLHVTSPTLSDRTLEKACKKYLENLNKNSEYDSLATVEVLRKYIWNEGHAVNYDPDSHPRSQDLPEYFALNFAINIISRDKMISRKNIVGKKFYPYVLDDIESIDVDTHHDFKIAEFFYNTVRSNDRNNK